MHKDKSQHGEAKFLADYLVNKKIMLDPLFVDVGAGDGQQDSNSFYFVANYPWYATLIDMNVDKLEEAFKFYASMGLDKKVKTVEAVIADRVSYYTVEKGKEWSLDNVKLQIKKSKDEKKTTKLSTILKSIGKQVGILSLDLESQTTGVLGEVLKAGIKPQALIVEGNTKEDQAEQFDMLADDYDLLHTVSVNQVFIRKDKNVK